jgi:hypothetical protein
MSETLPIYQVVPGKAGEEPFFNAERVEAFYEIVNGAFRDEFQGERFEEPPQDENMIAAHIGLYALISERPDYTAKTAAIVTSYLQGLTPSQNVRLANKKFKSYLPNASPKKLLGRNVQGIVNEAAKVIATCIETDNYTVPKRVDEITQSFRSTGPKAVLMEVTGPISAPAQAVRRFVELCHLTSGEAFGLFDALNPESKERYMVLEQRNAVDKIRRLLAPTTLLDKQDQTLTLSEKMRVKYLTDELDPQSAYMQLLRTQANAGDERRIVADLQNGLLKCAKYLDGSA